jgi:hypothetical protein
MFYKSFPAASLLLSCVEYRIAARKQQGSTKKLLAIISQAKNNER